MKISENIIKNNGITGYNVDEKCNGISLSNSQANINFNVITGNAQYGLYNTGNGTVNTKNNWWGSNSQPVVSSTSPSDICNASGTVTYNPWIILSVNVSSTNSGGNTSVTADLTHNNINEDISSQGHIPNGVPVNFATNLGTIVNSAYTVKGKATTILELGSTQSATVNVSASLDNQTVSTQEVIATGSAILNITSTAIDNTTGQPLNTSYTIPLNSSVTWLSVLWINTGTLQEELQIIVNGTVVKDIQFHEIHSIDNLTIDLTYPGVAGQNVTVTDPDNSSNVMNLSFPGNSIHRVSQIVYNNNWYDNAPVYEGVRSFAIATTKVTRNELQYWLDQSSNYQTGTMITPYGRFITALMAEYCHDQVADNVTSEFNVTWARTSPIVVSAGNDTYQAYLTLDCDHSMGMTVVGLPEDMASFRFACSSPISAIEYNIMKSLGFNYQYNTQNPATEGSVMTDMAGVFNNGTALEAFESNGFVLLKALGRNDLIFVIDPETGIVRDMNTVNGLCGAYFDPCDPYYDNWTDSAYNLGNMLLGTAPAWLTVIDDASKRGGNDYYYDDQMKKQEKIEQQMEEDALFKKLICLQKIPGTPDDRSKLIAGGVLAIILMQIAYMTYEPIYKWGNSTNNTTNNTINKLIIERGN